MVKYFIYSTSERVSHANRPCFTWYLYTFAGGDGKLGCLCGKAGTSHLCDGSAHSSGCVVNAMAAV